MALAAIGLVGQDVVRWGNVRPDLSRSPGEGTYSYADDDLMHIWHDTWNEESQENIAAEEVANSENDGGYNDPFEFMRRQFEYRRQAQADEHARAMAEVDTEQFQHDPPHINGMMTGGNSINLELCGALPPTCNRRGFDVAASTAIVRSEKEAARELIRIRREADAARITQSAESVRKRATGSCDPPASARPVVDSPSPPQLSPIASSATVGDLDFEQSVQSVELVKTKKAISSNDTLQSPMRHWEARIAEFYDKWEAQKYAEEARKARERDDEEQTERNKQVREYHFALNHRNRENKITAARKRMNLNEAHERYRDEVEVKLAENTIARKHLLANCQSAAAQRREKAEAVQTARTKALGFLSQGALIEKTCRLMDAKKVRAQEREQACERVSEIQEKRVAQAARARSRRALLEAQQRVRDASHRGRVLYMAKQARVRQEQREEEVRQRIAAERDFKACVQAARGELEKHDQLYKAENSDLQRYEESLAVLRDLAQSVQDHGRRIISSASGHTDDLGDQDPLAELPPQLRPMSSAEPRVRAMLGLSATPEDDETAWSPETPTSPANALCSSVDKSISRGSTRASPRAMDQSSPSGRTDSSIVATPTPRPPSRPRSQMSVSPLVVRPLHAICQSSHGKRSRTPNKAAASKDLQSLAYLRKIRQTGPLVKY